ncbi:DUF3810 domain-containing protein [Flavobacterium sp.]|uniref:DUF3810 domain-containing protein n=1 Tax=Flavobacterium sp. TaxID=239 RepID=UPI0039E3E550
MRKKFLLPILLLVQIILVKILSLFPDWIEWHYSLAVYQSMSKFSRSVLGSVPFSVGDVIYFIFIFLVLHWFWKKRGTWKMQWRSHALQILSFLSVFYFLFHALWALNYHREKLFDKLAIQREYTDADLLQFTQKLITRTNEIHYKITHNDSAKVVFPYSQEQTFRMNLDGYNRIAKIHPYFAYQNLCVKKSLLSLPLSYMGFAGYLNPFTNEAQVNDKIPMYNFATTSAHEMAHQIGYASESEANFIGYFASVHNTDLYFQYSGYSYALKYCLRNWKIRDEKTLEKLMPTIHPGILKNYEESEQFWAQYETFIETGFKIFYDNFLKFNQQKDGLESYSKFVDLLVNYYKLEKF